jgi:hypothetical protein
MGGGTSSAATPPPPSFDTAYLPQQQQQQQELPPPAFHSGLLVSEAPSAPSFDLLMMDPAPMMAPPPPPMMPPSSSSAGGPQIDDEAIRMILAMEGMSDADKQQLIQEQLKILQSIESKKKSSHVSAADAFEQRSFSAAVGATTSSNRSNAPPDFATIDMGGSATDDELAQMEADRLLAQELQKEEYESADRHEAREEQRRAGMAASSSSDSTTLNTNATTNGSSWLGWLGLSSTTPSPATTTRSEEHEVQFVGNGGAGRTAEPAPLFACVADSINSAANYALSLPQDDQGNVHGVDATSLLAVPQVGRNNNTNTNNNNNN